MLHRFFVLHSRYDDIFSTSESFDEWEASSGQRARRNLCPSPLSLPVARHPSLGTIERRVSASRSRSSCIKGSSQRRASICPFVSEISDRAREWCSTEAAFWPPCLHGRRRISSSSASLVGAQGQRKDHPKVAPHLPCGTLPWETMPFASRLAK